MTKRQLILEDGTVFVGQAFGSETVKRGEVVFYTGMTGYQEVITDPNYSSLIVMMTYPVVGGYGINRDDFETIAPFVNGVIVKEVAEEPSNFRSEENLDSYLKKYHIPGLAGIDTRMLTRLLRTKGTLRGVITNIDANIEEEIALLKNKQEELLVKQASVTRPYIVPGRSERVVVVDLGMKHGILHELTQRQCNVTVVPYNYSAENIMNFKPDGVIFSNGPGNPAIIEETVTTIKQLQGKIPLFSIGLGHQLFAIANGASTEKLHVGNFGTNFPVMDLTLDRSWITTQSRHYTVTEDSLSTDLEIMMRSLDDNTIQGLRHKTAPAFSVQFNPEGAPGSNEANYLFDEFITLMKQMEAK